MADTDDVAAHKESIARLTKRTDRFMDYLASRDLVNDFVLWEEKREQQEQELHG